MAINQLIARGIAPIGQDLPQIGNMLFQRDQARQQNALAEMAARTDATRANAFAQQVAGQQQSAQDRARAEALQRSFDVAAQYPEVLPQFVADLRQSVAPDLPENASLAQIAMRLQLKAPQAETPYSVTTQPGPFGSQIVSDGRKFDIVSPPAPKGSPSPAPAPGGGTQTGKFGAPRLGTNPDTGQPGYFQADQFGNVKWLEATSATGAEAEAREGAKLGVKATADLPRIQENARQMFDVLYKLKNAPLDLIYGAASVAPIVPGTKQADTFALWEQVNGKAFLQAFDSLKGGGQITEKEGEKATAAITRLSQRKMSPAAAKAAITELQAIAWRGLKKAEASAQGAAPAAQGNVVDFGSLPP